MHRYRKFIQSNLDFLLPYIAFILILIPAFILIPKNTIHLFINSHHSLFADYLFRYITCLGDGIVPFLIATVLLFFSIRSSFYMALGGTLAGLTAQFFKRIVFPEIKRPVAVFNDIPGFHLIEGVDMNSAFSFPSGHAATIFAVCLILAGLTRNKGIKLVLFLVALIVGFSRVYLSQHFLIDYYAGSFLGVLSAIFVVGCFDQFGPEWMNKSVVIACKRRAWHE